MNKCHPKYNCEYAKQLEQKILSLNQQINDMKCCFNCTHQGDNLKRNYNSNICKDCIDNGVQHLGKLTNWKLKE